MVLAADRGPLIEEVSCLIKFCATQVCTRKMLPPTTRSDAHSQTGVSNSLLPSCSYYYLLSLLSPTIPILPQLTFHFTQLIPKNTPPLLFSKLVLPKIRLTSTHLSFKIITPIYQFSPTFKSHHFNSRLPQT